jgi:hypothetical protein
MLNWLPKYFAKTTIFSYTLENFNNTPIAYDDLKNTADAITTLYNCFLQKKSLEIETNIITTLQISKNKLSFSICDCVNFNNNIVIKPPILLSEFTQYLVNFILFLQHENPYENYKNFTKQEYLAIRNLQRLHISMPITAISTIRCITTKRIFYKMRFRFKKFITQHNFTFC